MSKCILRKKRNRLVEDDGADAVFESMRRRLRRRMRLKTIGGRGWSSYTEAASTRRPVRRCTRCTVSGRRQNVPSLPYCGGGRYLRRYRVRCCAGSRPGSTARYGPNSVPRRESPPRNRCRTEMPVRYGLPQHPRIWSSPRRPGYSTLSKRRVRISIRSPFVTKMTTLLSSFISAPETRTILPLMPVASSGSTLTFISAEDSASTVASEIAPVTV